MSKNEMEKRILELWFNYKLNPNSTQVGQWLAEISRLGEARANAK